MEGLLHYMACCKISKKRGWSRCNIMYVSAACRNAIQPSQAQELSNVLTRVGTQVDDMIAFVRNLGYVILPRIPNLR